MNFFRLASPIIGILCLLSIFCFFISLAKAQQSESEPWKKEFIRRINEWKSSAWKVCFILSALFYITFLYIFTWTRKLGPLRRIVFAILVSITVIILYVLTTLDDIYKLDPKPPQWWTLPGMFFNHWFYSTLAAIILWIIIFSVIRWPIKKKITQQTG